MRYNAENILMGSDDSLDHTKTAKRIVGPIMRVWMLNGGVTRLEIKPMKSSRWIIGRGADFVLLAVFMN